MEKRCFWRRTGYTDKAFGRNGKVLTAGAAAEILHHRELLPQKNPKWSFCGFFSDLKK